MNDESASLENLRDLAELPPVSWWPMAPGWWLLIVIAGILLLVAAIRSWRRWRANAYRRTALRELAEAKDVAAIADILKRTALCAYPRTEIAALSGRAWCDWLQKTGGDVVPDKVAQSLTTRIYADRGIAHFADSREYVRRWIRNHTHQSRQGLRKSS